MQQQREWLRLELASDAGAGVGDGEVAERNENEANVNGFQWFNYTLTNYFNNRFLRIALVLIVSIYHLLTAHTSMRSFRRNFKRHSSWHPRRYSLLLFLAASRRAIGTLDKCCKRTHWPRTPTGQRTSRETIKYIDTIDEHNQVVCVAMLAGIGLCHSHDVCPTIENHRSMRWWQHNTHNILSVSFSFCRST